jgi:PAS domain S-box-containing protein
MLTRPYLATIRPQEAELGSGVERPRRRVAGRLDWVIRRLRRDDLRRQIAVVGLLQEVAVAANESSTVEYALQLGLDRVCAHTGWPVGHVYLPARDSPDELVPTALWHLEDAARFQEFRSATEATRLAKGVGLPGRVLASGKPLWINDVTKDPNFPRARLAQDIGVRAGFAFPVLVGSEVVAVMEFFSAEPEEPNEPLLDVMANIGAQLGRVIERRRAEEALEETKEHYRTIIETANDAFIAIDTSGEITDWNDQAEAIFGWSREEALGLALTETIIPPEYREGHTKGLQRFLATGEGTVLYQTLELTALHREGHEFPVELTIWPVRVGRTTRFNAFVREITERKRAEAEREGLLAREREQNERLRELDRLKDDIIASVSHELRTPLTSIRGYLDLLREGEADQLTSEQRSFLDVVDRNTGRLLRLGDLLFLAQVDTGKIPLKASEFDLPELVQECVEAARPLAERERVDVTLQVERLPALSGDRARLAQLIDNLISNALKFTPVGGRVEITTLPSNGHGLIEVSDTGVGIPVAEQERLFERFFRTASAREGAFEGTGLGLSIAKAIADAHGGTISVESEEGQGTTVRVALPLEISAAAEREWIEVS